MRTAGMNRSNRFRLNRRLVVLCVLLLLAACAPAGPSTPLVAATETARAPHPTVTALPLQPTSMPAPTSAAAVGQIKVFISTDMSSDDVVALLYLLQHPDVQVLGIGSSDGVAHVQPAALNVLRLLALLGRQDIPVAVGSETPLEGDHAFPGLWRAGADQLFGLLVPEATAEPVTESTAELLASVVNAHPNEVVIVLLGAHTDLARALRQDPALVQRIKSVHMMGGAVHVPGNIHAEYSVVANETAEWNLWLDYIAAAEVFASGIPLRVVPLDVTNTVRVDMEYRERFDAAARSAAAQTVAQLWKGQSSQSAGFFIWDVVAAVVLTAPEAAQWEEHALAIVTDGRDELGRIVLQPEKPPDATVCLAVDVPHLHDELIDVLNR
jgi:inosine-uridine nucleoside N-ribohydrolase